MKIPAVFDQPGATFTFMAPGSKWPPIDPPTGWQLPENGHSYKEALAYNGNVGIRAGNGYVGLDQDVPEVFKGLVVPTTTTWETRPGRLGMWLQCAGVPPELMAKHGKPPNHSQFKLFKDGLVVGELKLERCYQVIPPSWKTLDPEDGGQIVQYKMLDSSPPALIDLVYLVESILALPGVSFNKNPKSKSDTADCPVEAMPAEATERPAETPDERALSYATAALLSELEIVAKAPVSTRYDQVYASGCNLGEFVAAGLLPFEATAKALIEAGVKSGLTWKKAGESALNGLKKTANKPRKIPEKSYVTTESSEPTTTLHKKPLPAGQEDYKAHLEGNLAELEEIKQARIKQKFQPEELPVEIPAKDEPGPCDIKGLLDVYKKWLYIKEDYSVVGPMVAAIANFCPGDPDIIGIIAPSGSTKTEGIRALGQEENQFIYPLSSLTEHTFISGYVDKKGKTGRDLAPELKHRLLVIKDLTTILSKKEDIRSQIFADFRELMDGYIEKEFGNGTKKLYKDIHSSILFACTNAIERYYSMYSNLGQRMIFMRPNGDKVEARKQSVKNRPSLKAMRAEIHKATMEFLQLNIDRTKMGLPTTPDVVAEEMGPLFDFLAVARTSIHHDMKGDIDEIPEPEYPTRIANTLTRLIEVHALVYGRDEVGPEDVAFGIRIIKDNVPTTRLKLLEIMSEASAVLLATPTVATKAELPTNTAKRVLDEMFALHLVDKVSRDSKDEDDLDRRSDSYQIKNEFLAPVQKLKIEG